MRSAGAKMERPSALTSAPGSAGATADPGDGRERRRSARRRALKTAQIVFNNGNCTMACHILDTSETGALLMVGDILLCPDQFVLKPLIGPERACEIAWRRGTKIGIRYT